MLSPDITVTNINRLLSRYLTEAESVAESIAGLRGVRLLSALKRDAVGAGPYPNVTLFEAANRIMTDLVMLHGVRWLLKHEVSPFREYTVEYGHGNEGAHDIVASEGGKVLIGEVFNVAPSLFPLKKASALKKLRASKSNADYRVILVNQDAVAASYVPRLADGEHLVFVDIQTGDCKVRVGQTPFDGFAKRRAQDPEPGVDARHAGSRAARSGHVLPGGSQEDGDLRQGLLRPGSSDGSARAGPERRAR